jgi:hypothetical protein
LYLAATSPGREQQSLGRAQLERFARHDVFPFRDTSESNVARRGADRLRKVRGRLA